MVWRRYSAPAVILSPAALPSQPLSKPPRSGGRGSPLRHEGWAVRAPPATLPRAIHAAHPKTLDPPPPQFGVVTRLAYQPTGQSSASSES